jgi:predicted RNase H-like nuclease (RuvC/YqgF family)
VASTAQVNRITGKKVDDAIAPYLNPEDLRDVYLKAQPSIVVNNGNGTEVKRKLGDLELENKHLKEKLENMEQSLSTLSTNQQTVIQGMARDAYAQGLNTEDLKVLRQMMAEFAGKKKQTQ